MHLNFSWTPIFCTRPWPLSNFPLGLSYCTLSQGLAIPYTLSIAKESGNWKKRRPCTASTTENEHVLCFLASILPLRVSFINALAILPQWQRSLPRESLVLMTKPPRAFARSFQYTDALSIAYKAVFLILENPRSNYLQIWSPKWRVVRVCRFPFPVTEAVKSSHASYLHLTSRHALLSI